MGNGTKKTKKTSKTKSIGAADEKTVKGLETGSRDDRPGTKVAELSAGSKKSGGTAKTATAKTVSGKKAGGKARARNSNLKLVKNGDAAPPKKDSSGAVASPKKDSSGAVASPKKDSSGATVSPKKDSSGTAASKGKKETVKKEAVPQKASEKKTSGKKASEKKTSGKKVSEKKASRKKASGKKSSRKKISKKKSRKESGFSSSRSYIAYDDKSYTNRPAIGEWFLQHRSLVIIWLTVFAVVGGLVWAYRYMITNYRVTTVYVDGNVHYSNEEVMEMVMTGVYGNNSLYLAMKYKDKGVEGVPFVERMDVDILTPNTIRISVYEKALAGYVEYLGRYMYFDRDGIVVESSKERTEGIPQVTGLKFNYVVLNEALPVENDGIFKKILSITQLLDKYELAADKIYFDSDYDLTLFFDGVRVTLGESEEIDEKIMRLQYILPELAGKTGTLSMEKYTEDTKLIPFHQD